MAVITLPVTDARIVQYQEVGVPTSNVAPRGSVIVTLDDGSTLAMSRERFVELVPTAQLGAGGEYIIEPGYTIAPADVATGVTVSANAVLTFNVAMDPATIDDTTITLAPTSTHTPVAATVTMSDGDTIATLDPTSDLDAATEYEVIISSSVLDLAANPIPGAPLTTTFTTA